MKTSVLRTPPNYERGLFWLGFLFGGVAVKLLPELTERGHINARLVHLRLIDAR